MIKKKIVSPAALKKILKSKKNKKSVFTNGCFDILHAGHVTYLEKARALGDFLIVALNTDASTRRLKGSGRPINELEDRARVMAALASVDYVTWFDSDTPAKLIESLTPKVLVKGGDYEPRSIVGYDHVVAHGGKVCVIRFLKGRSTTKIIAKARSKK